ncbi:MULTISPECIES: hypothetical protein [unclassified Brevibacillus]|uniref:hypothetical protein n=1 Tax=unclassified Brevibacillus TaxID=2684853 RepID=UPI003561352A
MILHDFRPLSFSIAQKKSQISRIHLKIWLSFFYLSVSESVRSSQEGTNDSDPGISFCGQTPNSGKVSAILLHDPILVAVPDLFAKGNKKNVLPAKNTRIAIESFENSRNRLLSSYFC